MKISPSGIFPKKILTYQAFYYVDAKFSTTYLSGAL